MHVLTGRNRLQWQQRNHLKKPYILCLSAYISKLNSVTPIFYCRKVISRLKGNSLQSLKKFSGADLERP